MPNHDLRTLPTHKHLRAFSGVFLGLVCLVQVNAQTVTPVAGAFSVYNTFGDRNILSVAERQLSRQTLLDTAFSVGSSGDVLTASKSRLPVVVGQTLVVDVAAKVPKSAIVPAIGRFLGKTLPFLGVGVAVYDLAKELDFNLHNDNGNLVITRTKSVIVCNKEPCNPYWVNFPAGRYYGATPASACSGGAAASTAVQPNFRYSNVSSSGNSCTFTRRYYDQSELTETFPINYQPVDESVFHSEDGATKQDLLDAIASKSVWPSSSALARTVVDAINSGEVLDEKNPVLSGPSSAPPITSTKTDSSTNSTTTTTTTNNYSYSGPTITTTTNTTDVTVNNTSGEVIKTTQTTQEPLTPEQGKEFCDSHPQANGCREDEFDIPEGEIPKTDKNITFEPVDLGLGGGSCPPNIVKNYSGTSVTVFDWADSCSKITTYAKPAILLMAIFTAMGIIFIGVPVK